MMTSIFIVIFKEKKYNDTFIENNQKNISEYVETAKAILDIKQTESYLNSMSLKYENGHSKQPNQVQLSFVVIDKKLFFCPYIYYEITLDIENSIAKDIRRLRSNYIVYSELNPQLWDCDVDSVISHNAIVETLRGKEISHDNSITVIITNYEWIYRAYSWYGESIEIHVNPQILEVPL